MNSNITWVHCAMTKITVYALFISVHALKNIKNGSHGTNHTFKNYFATVFSVFSFQFLVSTTISSIQTDPIRIEFLLLLLGKEIINLLLLEKGKTI